MSDNILRNKTFEDYSKRMFRILLGLSNESFEALVDWGINTGKNIFIPKSNLSKYTPDLGVINDIPYVLFSPDENTSIKISDKAVFGFDVIHATGWLLSGHEEILFPEIRDKYGRWDEKNSIISKGGLTDIPSVNIWICILQSFLDKKNFDYVGLWPNDKKYAVILSHDVDNPKYSVFKHFKNLICNLFTKNNQLRNHLIMKFFGSIIIKGKDIIRFSFKQGTGELQKIENSFNVKSTYFFSSILNNEDYRNYNDPNYEVNDLLVAKSISNLEQEGFNIGLHPATKTAPYQNRYSKQKKELESVTKNKIKSIRHHYWNISRKDTADALLSMSNSGFEVDSSISFYKDVNFRRSVALPFTTYHLTKKMEIPILEIPCTFMDNWTDRSSPGESVLKHINFVKKYNGVAVLNWHVNNFNNYHFNSKKKAYEYTLKRLSKEDDVWITTIEDVLIWWNKRIEVINN